ncbi:cellulose-binding domain-containing protein [Luedemannella flava]|uniref:Cellulose-binding domain-containing protein n=1 Tax=Luedemannella flava TaxID=349316 RepID=A0ABP4XSM6_9ACTN
MWISRWRSRRGRTVAAAAALASGLAATAVALVIAPGANAATGCQVTYAPNSWPGGFTANIRVSGGDQALSGWTVTWSYSGDQRITNGWNATVSQSGTSVTATNMSYNGNVAANAATEFGVQGTYSSSNPTPTAFAVNGVACGGTTTTSAAVTSRAVTSAPVTSRAVTSAPVTSRAVTSAPVTSAPVTSAPVTSAPVTSVPPAGCSGASICDGFESLAAGTPSGAWSVQNPNCSGSGTATIDTTTARSGSKSLKVNGTAGYCNHVFVQSATALTGNTWYARFYVRHTTALPSSHVTFLAMKDTADGGRDLRMGGQGNKLQWNRESDDQTLPVQSPVGLSYSVDLPTNTWTCVEFMVSGANGQMQTWINGADVAGLREDMVATADIDSQWVNSRPNWRPALSNFRIGWESYGEGADTLWYDDVAVGASRIGC